MSLPFINDTVGDLLNNYVKFITKQMQTVADAIFGEDNENNNELINIPQTLQCRGLFKIQCKVADLSSLMDLGFYGWDYNYGLPPLMCGVDINFNNGALSISGLTPIGRTTPDTWYSGGAGYDAMANLATEYISTHSGDYIFAKDTYPNEPIDLTYYVDWSGSHGTFRQHNETSVFKTTLKDYANNEYTASNVALHFANVITENNGYYVENTYQLDQNAAGTYIVQSGDGLMVTNTDNQQFINDYITNNNSDHNYTYNYTTANGDDVTVYYGDNYVITKSNPDAKTTYDEYKTVLDVVANQINIDTGTHIKVPSYTDNKYGPVIKIKDVETEMDMAYISGVAGMVHYIKINDTGLATADDISNALSRFDITTIGKDLLRNFVSFKVFALLDIDPDNTVTKEITVAGHILKDENDANLQGQYIGGVKSHDFTIGKAPKLFRDFRDYEPYTKIEAYIPFCGWFKLPSWCIGKTIHGTMFTDICNGTVKAVVYANDTVVAEVGGCCAFDIPFVADATGAKAGAVISSALNTAAMTGATLSAPNIATGIAAVSSAANFVSAINSNSTTLKGVLGDGSNLNGLLHTYLKVTRPQTPTELPTIPNSYRHDFGVPCFQELKLTAGDGYTQIMDANITGAMTDREKQMIIDGFRHGLIL